MDPNEDRSSHVHLLRIVYIINEVLTVFNLLFIIHNIYKYVFGLKMQKPLIVTFYVLILLGTVLRIIILGLYIVNPEDNFLNNEPVFYAERIALFVFICIELILIQTMHKLRLCLRQLMDEIAEDAVENSEKAGLVFAIVFGSIFFGLEVFVLI